MRTLCAWRFAPLIVLLLAAGCTRNPNGGAPFAGQPNGTQSPFAAGPLASLPRSSPSQDVRELEQWRNSALQEYQKLQAQLAAATSQNRTLEQQVGNARQHAKLQDEHLAGVSGRLKDATAELTQLRGQGTSHVARSDTLDRVNQEKERQLAAARRDVQRMQADLKQTRSQLSRVNQELARTVSEKTDAQQQAETLLAASRRRSGATITPNTNLTLPNLNLAGVDVRRDGDVVRVQIPSDELFEPNGVQLRPGAATLLGRVGSELARLYSVQRIGIEGHTDSGSPITGPWRDHHHLSSAQAMAVYEFLTRQALLGGQQMHVVGHGANHPIYSSGTAGGRRGNQRVELVIYPETTQAAYR